MADTNKMRTLEVVKDGNSQSKLTVTPDRVSLKVGANDTPAREAILKAFAEKVANTNMDVTQSYRGMFSANEDQEVTLYNSNRKKKLKLQIKDGEVLSATFSNVGE